MLEAIREHAQGWIAKIILGLIVLSFAIWGVDWYFQGGGKEAGVASIDGDEISQTEFFQALQTQKESMEASTGGKVDMDNKAFRQEVLDQMVNIRLLGGAARQAGMTVTAAQVDAMLQGIPAFQENGQFSEARLEIWLRNRGMTRQALAGMLSQDMLLRQLQFGYGEGALVASASARQLADLLAQQREVNEAIFAAKDFLAGVSVDDKAVAAEYQAHQADYAVPAQVRLQYVVLSAEAIQAGVSVSDEAARQYYEGNRSRYQEPEQRRASHILIKADAAMAAADRQAAKAKAEQLLKEVQQAPGRFADLARQHSQDTVSAARGGDLGNFTRDMMVKPFADAAYGLKVGQISPLVETEFGYHIIRLDAVTPGTQLGFDLVKAEIVADLRRQEAQRKFAEAADRFSNLVYEQPDSLAPAAKEFQLPVQESGWVSRQNAEPAMLANARLMDAVFAPEALDKKQNTEAVEVRPGTLVAARVLEHKAAGVRPLAEVAEVIRLKLASKAAADKAVASGKQALQAAQAGQAVAGMSAPMQVSRMQPMNLPVEAVKAVFKADVAKLPAFVGVETREGYRLYRINAVKAGETAAEQAKVVRRDLTRLAGQEELRAYLEYNRAQAEVTVNNQVLDKRAE
jgi:peptidyl-prolyl cis-trans isomerase D